MKKIVGLKKIITRLTGCLIISALWFLPVHAAEDPDLVDMVPESGLQETAVQETEDDGWFLSDLFDLDVMHGRQVSNILMIGEDARDGQESQRSDAMIIASINTATGSINLVSLMRDMYLEIPGYGSNRINAAYSLGGTTLLEQTIEQNFGVGIDHYMKVDLEGFLRTMATVGSIDIELTQEEADYLNANDSFGTTDDSVSDGTVWNLHAGLNALTPEQALAYSRIRFVGNSDYERTERQRKVMMAAFSKFKDVGVFSLIGVVTDVMNTVESDLSIGEVLGYCYVVLTGNLGIGTTTRIPADGTFSAQVIDGMEVLVPDLAANRDKLNGILNGI